MIKRESNVKKVQPQCAGFKNVLIQLRRDIYFVYLQNGLLDIMIRMFLYRPLYVVHCATCIDYSVWYIVLLL